MVTAWDQWGNAAYDQITVEIVPPYINTSHAITTNGVLGVGPQNKHHEKGGYVMLNIDHGLNLADISGFEVYVNYRRGVTQDEEKDRGGRLRWDKDTDTTSLVWADGAPKFRPALNLGWSLSTTVRNDFLKGITMAKMRTEHNTSGPLAH